MTDLSFPEDWKPAPLSLERIDDGAPAGGKTLPEEWHDPGPVPTEPTMEQRIYAVARWAAALAVKELVDGTELTMRMRDAGPQAFLAGENEWERINETARIGIRYVMEGR